MKCEYCGGLGRYVPFSECDHDEVMPSDYVVCRKCGGSGELRKFKGLLIDPSERTVTEVDTDGSLQSLYTLIGCTCVDVARGGFHFLPSHPDDDLWFDEEGFFLDCNDCFVIPGMAPLIGKGLILGYNEVGDSIGHTMTPDDIAELRKNVIFETRIEAGR